MLVCAPCVFLPGTARGVGQSEDRFARAAARRDWRLALGPAGQMCLVHTFLPLGTPLPLSLWAGQKIHKYLTSAPHSVSRTCSPPVSQSERTRALLFLSSCTKIY